ncbi:MAG: CcoQ/FixQ family Cbb3-type cytochrome c oxidase assembly chaperone [Rubrivivax sp.]|nr:MAG: CcoQ/FixQ family Cbb3-type cytochrome c oxidase assembly chaperone [Rubrivivax sp.]
MDINVLRSAFTVVSLCIFVGIVAWAYARANQSKFEEAARLPLAED